MPDPERIWLEPAAGPEADLARQSDRAAAAHPRLPVHVWRPTVTETLQRRAELIADWHAAQRAEWAAEHAWLQARELVNRAEKKMGAEGFTPHGDEIQRRDLAGCEGERP
jgi:transposase InsO family protein